MEKFQFSAADSVSLNIHLKISLVFNKNNDIMATQTQTQTTFNTEQQIFVADMIQLLDTPSGFTSGKIALNAPAGTGKTFCIKYLSQRFPSKLQCLAPTHKAESLYRRDGLQCMTLHRFLHAVQQFTPEGKEYYEMTPPNDITAGLVIVDEASLINQEIYDILHELSHSVCVLFVGDACQLAPINDEAFSVFRHVDRVYRFTENKRGSDSHCGVYIDAFRHAIVNSMSLVPVTHTLPSFQPRKVSLNQAVEQFKAGDDAVIIVYTNAQRASYNKHIHCILARMKLDIPTHEPVPTYFINESLVFMRGFREVGRLRYYSSDTITVKKVSTIEEVLPLPMCKHQILAVKNSPNKRTVPLCYDCGMKGSRAREYTLKFHHIIDQHDTPWLKPLNEDDKEQLAKLKKRKRDLILALPRDERSGWWSNYYAYCNRYDAPIDYPYALTTHKAQGSEWSYVYVDIGNMRHARDINTFYRLAYTGCTRMRQEFFFLR